MGEEVPDQVGAPLNNSMVAIVSLDKSVEGAYEEEDAAFASSNAAGCFASESMLRGCGTRCFARPAGTTRANCVASCLQNDQHLGHSCASCYGQRSDCTMVHCLTQCTPSASSHDCTSCVHGRCGGPCR